MRRCATKYGGVQQNATERGGVRCAGYGGCGASRRLFFGKKRAFAPLFWLCAGGGIPIVPLAARASNRDWIVRFRAPALNCLSRFASGGLVFLKSCAAF